MMTQFRDYMSSDINQSRFQRKIKPQAAPANAFSQYIFLDNEEGIITLG